MKTFLKIGLILSVLFCLSPFVSAQTFTQTPFIAWSPDGSKIAIGFGTSVQILDADSLQVLNTISGLDEQKIEPAWSPDGERLAVANGPDLEIWENPWEANTTEPQLVYRYYGNEVRATSMFIYARVAWESDGSRLAVAIGAIVDIVDSSSVELIRQVTEEWSIVTDVIWNADGRLTVATHDMIAANMNPETGELINYLYLSSPGPVAAIMSLDFSPDGNQLVVSNEDGVVVIWENTRTTERKSYPEGYGLLIDNNESVNSVDWSPAGRYIATASNDGTVRIWDATTKEQVQLIQVGTYTRVQSVAWSPDGAKLAYGNPDGTITIIPAPMSAATPTPTSAGYFIPPCPRICGTATATPEQ